MSGPCPYSGAVTSDDPVRRRARHLAAHAVASGDPVGWFETLYAEAGAGRAVVPWDDGQANPHLTEWANTAAERGIVGPGRRALVVGCGVCDDPGFLASLGCEVTAFDVSPTAVAEARRRFPRWPVDYQVADLLALPPGWQGAFGLVVEIYTVQVLYGEARRGDPGPVRPGSTRRYPAGNRPRHRRPGPGPRPSHDALAADRARARGYGRKYAHRAIGREVPRRRGPAQATLAGRVHPPTGDSGRFTGSRWRAQPRLAGRPGCRQPRRAPPPRPATTADEPSHPQDPVLVAALPVRPAADGDFRR